MTRLYIQPSWIDAASDNTEWSGGNGQYRGDRSVEVVPTYINGKPNVKAFSDEAIEARRPKKKTSVPLEQRILPQASRLDKLNAEIVELENEYRSGNYSIEKYSMLRAVAFKKRDRAVELYKKAIKVEEKAPSTVGHDYTPIASNRYQIPAQNTGNEVKLARYSAKAIKDDNKLFFGGILVCFAVWMVVKSFM